MEENKENKINTVRKSYISKEDFINMIQNLNFDAIREARIEFVTGYEYIKESENETSYIKVYSYTLNID